MRKRLPLKLFNTIYSNAPRLCVDLVVKTKDGVLLTLRNIPPAKGFWHIPGGTVRHGEKLSDAVKRVGKEELGVNVKILSQLGVIEFLDKRTTFGGHAVTIEHLVKITKGKIKLNNQAKEARFFKKLPPKTVHEQKEFLRHNLPP